MTDHPLSKYRAWFEDSISPSMRGWNSEAVANRYSEALAQYQERTVNSEAAQRYAKACPVPGAAASLYQLQEVRVANNISLLAGIHFRGMSTEYPFVGVFAQSRWLSASEVLTAHETLQRQFSVFSPRASWWWTTPDKDFSALEGARHDQHLVAGSLEELSLSTAPALPSGWRLQRLSTAREVVSDYEEFYRAFHAARPDLKEAVQVTRLEDLEECAQASGLFACWQGSELVGLVAAKPEQGYGVNAWVMYDILLARMYCGQGLAPVLQRAVLDRLDRSQAPLVLGTIDATNLPSLNTALRVGRKIVGNWSFLCTQ